METRYEIIKTSTIKLKFKLDFNELTSQFDPHIWLRHLIMPEEALVAYLNKSEERYNKTFKRFEAYSATDDITFYYLPLSNDFSFILIITAIKGYKL